MIRLLHTLPFSDRDLVREEDPALVYAISMERLMREVRYREHFNLSGTVSLITEVAARDAGDVCHVCGETVTWVDHLPPLPGGVVRCYKNVAYLDADVVIDDIFPRV